MQVSQMVKIIRVLQAVRELKPILVVVCSPAKPKSPSLKHISALKAPQIKSALLHKILEFRAVGLVQDTTTAAAYAAS